MIKLKLFFLFNLFLVQTTFAQSWTADSLDFQQFLDLSIDEHFGLELARLEYNKTEMQYQAIQTEFKPQLSVSGVLPNYSKSSTPVTQPDGSISFQPISYDNSRIGVSAQQNIGATGGFLFMNSSMNRYQDFGSNQKSYYSKPLRLGFYQPLWGYNDLKRQLDLATLKKSVAQQVFDSDKVDLEAEICLVFFNILRSQYDLDLAKKNVNSAKALHAIAAEKYKLGKISKRDLIQLDLELQNEQQGLLNAQTNLETAKVQGLAGLGINPESTAWDLRTPEEWRSIQINEKTAFDAFSSNRREHKDLLVQMETATQNLDRIKANYGHEVAISASIGFVNTANSLPEAYQQLQNEQFVQVNFSLPIFDWGRKKKNMEVAAIEKKQTLVQAQQDIIKLKTNLFQYIDAFHSIQEQLNISKSITDMAIENYTINEKSYQAGAINLNDVTLARQQRDQILRQHLNLLAQYWTIYYQIRALCLYDFFEQKTLK